jgi:hypothetical protein
MTSPLDRVSVVIPTRNRPHLVRRAVTSALAQTHRDVEVIVVIDGPDPETAGLLATIADARLRVLTPETNQGAAAARNLAVRAATSPWIAFLDDDDAWLPEKLAAQLAAVPEGIRYPVMSCRCRVETARGTFVWPRRPARVGDDFADYLFARRGLFKGETFAPTTTLMVPRELLLEVPIPVSPFDDWEWLVLAGRVPGTALVTVPRTLAIHYAETGQVTLSTCRDIGQALDWAASMRGRMSERAYAGLLLQTLGGEANARTPAVRRRLLRMAWTGGRPSLAAWATFLAHSLAPVDLRRRVRRALYGEAATPGTARNGGPA